MSHLICVIKDHEYKIAAAGNLKDAEQGIFILHFLTNGFKKELFLEKLDNLTWASGQDLENMWMQCRGSKRDIAQAFEERYPYISKSCGANILSIVQNSQGLLTLRCDLNFAMDAIYCDWGYIIDFDSNTFEIYRGYTGQVVMEHERFGSFKDLPTSDGKILYPLKEIVSYDLESLPSKEQLSLDIKNYQ